MRCGLTAGLNPCLRSRYSKQASHMTKAMAVVFPEQTCVTLVAQHTGSVLEYAAPLLALDIVHRIH